MKVILKSHTGIDSLDKAYSFLKNFESIVGKDLVAYVSALNGFPCFKKISNESFFGMLVDFGKVTQGFISHYDTKEHISRRKLLNIKALRQEFLDRGYDLVGANNLLRYFIALYILNNEEAKKEFFFMMFYTNKHCIKKEDLFKVEIEEVPDELGKFILCKDAVDEDGTEPFPSVKGASLLEEITSKTITVDFAMKKKIQEIIEDQVNISDDDEAIKAFMAIADILGISIS